MCPDLEESPGDWTVEVHSFQTPEAMYRQQYFEVMDTASASLNCSADLILLNSNTCNRPS